MLGAVAALAVGGAARATDGTPPARPDRDAERAAWIGRSCTAPGCAAPASSSLAQGAAFACAVAAVAGLTRRRETDV